jgi:predicted transcriptional regulator
MHLYDIMDPRVSTVSANDYALEALRHMTSKNLEWTFVLDRNEISGVVFARDLEALPETTLKEKDVREYLTTNLVMVDVETEPQEAARLLRFCGRNFIGVVRGNQPVGILTRESLARPALALGLQAS